MMTLTKSMMSTRTTLVIVMVVNGQKKIPGTL